MRRTWFRRARRVAGGKCAFGGVEKGRVEMVNYMLSKGGRIALFLGKGCQVIGGCCSKLTGKKESASSFCFANSFSSSSSMSKGTAPVLRRAAELSPPRPPPRPPRPPLDMMFVCMCVL